MPLSASCAEIEIPQTSNNYRKLNMCLYKSYVLRVQYDLRSNPKNFWHFVNSKRKSTTIPNKLFLDAVPSTSTASACELFAQYFASVFAESVASDEEAELAAMHVPRDAVCLSTFNITHNMLLKAAKKLKRSYVPGPDGIPAIIYCVCADLLVEPLGRIFNRSFTQACFPAVWKESFITPIYKSGDRHNIKNYRGITNLSAASKLFEIVVAEIVLYETKHYISTDQHGFVPGRSVSTNLLNFTSTCVKHIENRAQVDVVYTDLKAAFDKIDHAILLRKISHLGASRQFVQWLNTYLTGRTLRVKVSSSVSVPFCNISGVPQGSNIGPLLFIIFFNDVAELLDGGDRLFYADDLKIYRKIQTYDDCIRLQGLLDTFVAWCKLNRLIISTTKCEVITFHRIASPIIYDYHIGEISLKRVNCVRDLGVLLDTKFSFNEHISAIINKANRQLGFIAKVAYDFTDPYCFKALYCALVRPILETACIVWSPYYVHWDLRIERIQKRFIRLALRNLPWNDPDNLPPYPDRCRLINMDTLQLRRKVQRALFIAKLLRGAIDSPRLLMQINFRTTQRIVRSSSLLQLNFHRTNYGLNEPFETSIHTFLSHEGLYDFNEPLSLFKNKLIRTLRN